MNMCNIHSQWYVNYCVYCGEPGKSKIQDLQTVEPMVITVSTEAYEEILKKLEEEPKPSEGLRKLFGK